MERGEMWWVNFPAPKGRRPAVLLTRDSAYQLRNAVTVAPITRTIRGIPVEVPVDQRDGLLFPSIVNLDDIGTIPKGWLGERIAQLSAEKMDAIARAIVYALDLGASL